MVHLVVRMEENIQSCTIDLLASSPKSYFQNNGPPGVSEFIVVPVLFDNVFQKLFYTEKYQ